MRPSDWSMWQKIPHLGIALTANQDLSPMLFEAMLEKCLNSIPSVMMFSTPLAFIKLSLCPRNQS